MESRLHASTDSPNARANGARHQLESGPRQTLLSFPEGNWIMTNQEALAFFGGLVETANRECVLPGTHSGCMAIDVCEISRDGISEQRYFSLDEFRVASLRDYREGARTTAGITRRKRAVQGWPSAPS